MQKTLSKEDVQKLFKLIDFDTDDEQSLEIFIDFANVVAAAEREACADIAESYEPQCDSCPSGVANAIRARGQG